MMSLLKKWVLLDRDGVINADSDDYIKSEEEWLALPGSLEALAKLRQAGFSIGVATNQSGIARGLYTQETLEKIHLKMQHEICDAGGYIDAIAYCPHGPDENCECRKPKPGLLFKLAQQHHFSLKNVPFIGDSLRDLQAAQSAGAIPMLVLTGKGADTLEKHAEKINNILVFEDLLAVSEYLTR